MLDIFQTEAVHDIQPVQRGPRGIAFICGSPLPAGEEARVKDTQGCKASVLVHGVRRVAEGAWLHFGGITSGELEALMPWPEGLRTDPRVKVGLRVRSVQLPG